MSLPLSRLMDLIIMDMIIVLITTYTLLHVYLSIWMFLTSLIICNRRIPLEDHLRCTKEKIYLEKVKRHLMKMWQYATSGLYKLRRCTYIWILQGMHDILCYVSPIILNGKVSPKVWWMFLSQMVLAYIWKWFAFMFLMMKWCTWYWTFWSWRTS